MRRHILLMLGIVAVLMMPARHALADCVIIEQIDTIHTLQLRLMRDPSSALFSSDLRQLRQLSGQISDRDALSAVDGNTLAGRGPSFVRFLDNTRVLLQRASMDDPFSVRPHFDRSVRRNLDTIATHLTELRCSAEQIAIEKEAQTDRAFAGDSDDRDQEEVQEALRAMAEEILHPRTGILLILFIGGFLVLSPIVRKWLIRRKRRAKRHNTRFTTRYRWHDRTIDGTLIDINCYGTKLKHEQGDAQPEGAKIQVGIFEDWQTGTVIWSNLHYSGIQFNRQISLNTVSEICAAGTQK